MTRGHFEELETAGGRIRLSGWMFNADAALTNIQVRRNGVVVGSQPPSLRPDVAAAFAWIAHSAQSGFQFDVSGGDIGDQLEVTGSHGSDPITRLWCELPPSLFHDAPYPSSQLMSRVSDASAGGFKAEGVRHFSELIAARRRHHPARIGKMLDWGCGCGRLSAHFLSTRTAEECFGCDIDPNAIDWCRVHLTGGSFDVVDPHPPMPYHDQSFDLIVACSVFSHLNAQMQDSWLREMRRILVPGGILLATVHGRFAAQFAFRPLTNGPVGRLLQRLRMGLKFANGFIDLADPVVAGAAPPGYYRAAFQTRDYTLRQWSKHVKILELVEGGMAYQDLIVLRAG